MSDAFLGISVVCIRNNEIKKESIGNNSNGGNIKFYKKRQDGLSSFKYFFYS